MNAGTIAECLVRNGLCTYAMVKVYFAVWTIEVNGVQTLEPNRIVAHGDIVTVNGEKFAV